jgi:hypothetical protein
VLQLLPSPPHSLHLSSLAEDPNIMSQPTGCKQQIATKTTMQQHDILTDCILLKMKTISDNFTKKKFAKIFRHLLNKVGVSAIYQTV